MKNILTIFLLIYVSISINAQNREEIIKFAQKEMPTWLTKIQSEYQNYGFSASEEINQAEIVTLYKVYNLTDSFYTTDNYVNPLIEKNVWYLPITVENITKCYLIVAKIENSLQVVGIGGNELAEKMSLCENEANEILKDKDKGYLHIDGLEADYIIACDKTKSKEKQFIPFNSTKKYIHDNLANEYYTENEALIKIKEKYIKTKNHE